MMKSFYGMSIKLRFLNFFQTVQLDTAHGCWPVAAQYREVIHKSYKKP